MFNRLTFIAKSYFETHPVTTIAVIHAAVADIVFKTYALPRNKKIVVAAAAAAAGFVTGVIDEKVFGGDKLFAYKINRLW